MLTIPGRCFGLNVAFCSRCVSRGQTVHVCVCHVLFLFSGGYFPFAVWSFSNNAAADCSSTHALCGLNWWKYFFLICSSERWTHLRGLQAQAVSFPLGSFWWQGLWAYRGRDQISCWGRDDLNHYDPSLHSIIVYDSWHTVTNEKKTQFFIGLYFCDVSKG